MVIEMDRVRVVCRRTMQVINYCGQCRTETDFVTAVEAARIVRHDAPTIFRLAEAGILHSLPASNGESYVCLASLEKFEENRFR